MAFIPIPNVAQVTVNATFLGQQVQNVYHVRLDDTDPEPSLQDVADTFIAWVIAELVANVSSDVEYRSVIVTDQSVQNGAQYTGAFPPATNGEQLSAPLPSSNTVAVSWRTGFSGRSFRGRTFHFGLVESQVTDNEVVGATLTALVADYAQLITDCATAGFPLVVASRYTNGAPRVTGIKTNILSLLIDPVIDSQRRRLPGRGR